MRKVFIFLVSILWVISVSALPAKQSPVQIKRVIYITFDGVRWQDFYINRKYFPLFWKKYSHKVRFYGMPNTNKKIKTASIACSLPSYQAQMAGTVQRCQDNSCGRIKVETLAEELVNQYHFKKQDVAIFASWAKVAEAVEHIPGTTFCNSGNYPVKDPVSGKADEKMAEINHQQAFSHPVPDDDGPERFDKYTFAQALHYLEKYTPRFLWISLVDADEAAHLNEYKQYHEALLHYDRMIDSLMTTLKKNKMDKDTLLIVTTDHGRADGTRWYDHGIDSPESKRMWAFVMNGELVPIGQQGKTWKYSTLSIRPTIEAVFTK